MFINIERTFRVSGEKSVNNEGLDYENLSQWQLLTLGRLKLFQKCNFRILLDSVMNTI